MAFDVVLSMVPIKYTNWNSSFFVIQRIARISLCLLNLNILIYTFLKNLIVLHRGDIFFYFTLTSVSNLHFQQ